jgi:hypothetical protein
LGLEKKSADSGANCGLAEEERRRSMNRLLKLMVLAVFVYLVLGVGLGLAADQPEAGWGKDGAYNKLYQTSEFDEFKGNVEEIIDITPLPDMTPGIGLKVKDQDKDMVTVHLGPKSFVKVDSIGLKKGDRVKVKGAWAQIGGKEVFMASKVKKGENVELKVRRTKDGMPYWAMTPEELAKEKE